MTLNRDGSVEKIHSCQRGVFSFHYSTAFAILSENGRFGTEAGIVFLVISLSDYPSSYFMYCKSI